MGSQQASLKNSWIILKHATIFCLTVSRWPHLDIHLEVALPPWCCICLHYGPPPSDSGLEAQSRLRNTLQNWKLFTFLLTASWMQITKSSIAESPCACSKKSLTQLVHACRFVMEQRKLYQSDLRTLNTTKCYQIPANIYSSHPPPTSKRNSRPSPRTTYGQRYASHLGSPKHDQWENHKYLRVPSSNTSPWKYGWLKWNSHNWRLCCQHVPCWMKKIEVGQNMAKW